MAESPTAGPIPQSAGRSARPRIRLLIRGALAGVLLAVLVEAAYVLLGSNLHAVLPGRIYRCAQLTGRDLERVLHRHGIRTVVNLRGYNPEVPWYLEEGRATARADVNQEDLCFAATRLPAPAEVRRLVEVLDRAERPLLFHCKRGADRTGLAALIATLLDGQGLDAARRQLGPRYGHVALGRTAMLDEFLAFYTDWLRERGLEHTTARFRAWLDKDYCPFGYRARLEPLDFPTVVERGRPAAFRVRVTNRGARPWRLCPGVNAGVHATFWLQDDRGVFRLETVGYGGLFDAVVDPSQSIDLTLVLAGVAEPGRYDLLVDMEAREHLKFYQVGSELLEHPLEVR